MLLHVLLAVCFFSRMTCGVDVQKPVPPTQRREISLATEGMLPTTSNRLAEKRRSVTAVAAAVVRQRCFVRQQ